MADAELYREIYTLIGCDGLSDGGGPCAYYESHQYENMQCNLAHDIIAMHALRWLGDRGWDTVFKHEGKTVVGDSSPFQKWICEESKARALLRAIRCQLERVADNG